MISISVNDDGICLSTLIDDQMRLHWLSSFEAHALGNQLIMASEIVDVISDESGMSDTPDVEDDGVRH